MAHDQIVNFSDRNITAGFSLVAQLSLKGRTSWQMQAPSSRFMSTRTWSIIIC